jgi:hypothetical protein
MLWLTPYMTFESPPRHVYKPDDVKGLTHDLGNSLPWQGDSFSALRRAAGSATLGPVPRSSSRETERGLNSKSVD